MAAPGMEEGLVGHWSFAGDDADASLSRLRGVNHNVVLGNDAASFNGRDSFIEIADPSCLRACSREFSVAAWVHTEKDLPDAVGDIMSQYDPDARKGFNLSVKDNTAGPRSWPNHRHVHFGVDWGSEPVWSRCGKPGNTRMVHAFAVYQGRLYAATDEPGADEYGHVHVYEGEENWSDCGHPDMSNAVVSLMVCEGRLYAATGCYDGTGSLLSPAENTTPGGSVFRYEGDGNWTDCGKPFGDKEGGNNLAAFRGRLYAVSAYNPGLSCYEGGKDWSLIATPETGFTALAAYNGRLYVAAKALKKQYYPDVSYPEGSPSIYSYDPKSGWVGCDPLSGVYSFVVYRGELIAGTWPNGEVFRAATGCGDWVNCGSMGCGPLSLDGQGELRGEIMGMAVYNGKLYVGSLPYAEVWRYDGDNQWKKMKRLDYTPNVRIRRAWSMAVFEGKLFVGVLPSGQVHCMEAGRNVSSDTELDPGWKHITAVRMKDKLSLYIDGVLKAASKPFAGAEADIENSAPLRIGFGAHDYFSGKMRDVRLYGRALQESEIAGLASA